MPTKAGDGTACANFQPAYAPEMRCLPPQGPEVPMLNMNATEAPVQVSAPDQILAPTRPEDGGGRGGARQTQGQPQSLQGNNPLQPEDATNFAVSKPEG